MLLQPPKRSDGLYVFHGDCTAVSGQAGARDVAARGKWCGFTPEGMVKLGDAEQMDGWTFLSLVGSTMKSVGHSGRFGRFRGGEVWLESGRK